jgi:hypothetical protein
MIDLDIFYPNILPKAPGCPHPTADNAIIQSGINLCERLRIWRSQDTFTIAPDKCNVVCAPDNAAIHQIESAYFNGQPLEPISIRELDHNHAQWRDMTSDGQARWITQIDVDTVRVVPATTGTLVLNIILKPSIDAEQFPEFLVSHYRNVIADGALAEILMLPGQSFSDPDRAMFYQNRYNEAVNRYSSRQTTGQQRAPMRSRMHSF